MAEIQPSNPSSIRMQSRIQWVDTDATGHYHYTTAFRLFDAAESLLRSRLELLPETQGKLPRVHASAEFRKVLHFNDVVDVHLAVATVGESSIRYSCEIRRDGELCVEGVVVAVLLSLAGGERVRWSERHRELLLRGGEQRAELLVTEGATSAPTEQRA